MSAPLVPAATVLRRLPGRRLVIGRFQVAHLYATSERARCGWRMPADARVLEQVDEAPPLRVCARCVGSLPPAQVDALRPDATELAAVHDREARLVAQRCIDDLERIRRRARLDGTAAAIVELTVSKPATHPAAPRPRTRAAQYAQNSGHVAAIEQTTLARLLNRLTPGGYSTEWRMFLLDPPAPGSRVDPQARRA
ncbi:hypothetical protein [Blastococcus sp. CCUG 61487]|uniref:hypothetical protein n=1 Tax=Blastococcus sp. CCUG 61487 TaxID=1840703 RepID=UPI0010C03BDF|nr:hypothetical protein [Blastococcus sp. CCUG 61487]